MPIWQKKRKQQTPPPAFCVQSVQTGQVQNPFAGQLHPGMIDQNANRLFEQIRQAVPVVDAAIGKIIRLVGGFTVVCDDSRVQRELDEFCARVQVGPSGIGLPQFLYGYLDDLLTYGNAAGEMVPLQSGEGLGALYNVPLDDLAVERGESPACSCAFPAFRDGVTPQPVPHPERILFSALNPAAGQIRGAVAAERPAVCLVDFAEHLSGDGQNFERMGNLRFAGDLSAAGWGWTAAMPGRSRRIWRGQWADTMRDGGQVKDFIAVGDVNIRVIGADNQVLDTQVPVRQMLEQIVAKLGLPPFILGLSWSTTERMSQQQAEILASELESYRELLNAVILRICRYHLNLKGMGGALSVKWKHVSMSDEVEQARAELLHMQAKQIEQGLAQEGKAQEEEDEDELSKSGEPAL